MNIVCQSTYAFKCLFHTWNLTHLPKMVSGPQLNAPARNKNKQLKTIPQEAVNENISKEAADRKEETPVPIRARPLNTLKNSYFINYEHSTAG